MIKGVKKNEHQKHYNKYAPIDFIWESTYDF